MNTDQKNKILIAALIKIMDITSNPIKGQLTDYILSIYSEAAKAIKETEFK